MFIAQTIDEVRTEVRRARGDGAKIALVPTMGFLHEGHLTLIDAARDRGATFVVVSIFVNPAQFGPGEDFERYPRNEAHDRRLLENRNVDLLFLPPLDLMYPPGMATRINISEVSEPLEGQRRPGHFAGVATVVLKLFNIVQPDLAVFGEKDAQQCAVIDRMVRDLDVPIELWFGKTERESDGLALSSRNAYLSPDERSSAIALNRALRAGERALQAGASPEQAESAMEQEVNEWSGVVLDYLKIVDPTTFRPPTDLDRSLLLVGAVKIGSTRLIDNIAVRREEEAP